jgi:excisionase family DNA binding protein
MTKLYNVSEVAGLLGLSTSWVYKMAERGEIEAAKIGTALRLKEEQIKIFINKCEASTQMITSKEV